MPPFAASGVLLLFLASCSGWHRPPKPPAADGYLEFPSVGSYKLHTTRANWTEALRLCQLEGAHLAIVNSQIESNVLRGLMAWELDVGNFAYLGFHDQNVEGHYETIFGEPLESTGYDQWGAGSPLGTTQFNCGCLHRSGGLCDYICEATIPYLCEK